jgi:integrase/recombinase XerD
MKQNQKTIIQYIPDFLEYLDIEKGLSISSQQTYQRLLKRLIFWLKKNNLENLKPHQLTPDHLWKFRVFLSRQISKNSQSPLKKTTQNYYLIALRSLLKFFADRDILSLPPEKVKLAKEKKERTIKFLSLDQVKALLEAPDRSTLIGLRDSAILETLFSTGMRVAELVNLNREQLKIKKDTRDLEITIIGKGGRPRVVYFSQRAVRALRDYLEATFSICSVLTEKALFINFSGPKNASRRLTTRSVENIIKKYTLKAGLPITTTPHTLRHSFASDLLAQGVDLRVIQEFLGHKNIATTQVYTHITSKKLRDIHRKFHGGKKF